MPLQEWPRVTASAIKELAYLGFRTVEQLAEANDEVKRRMGPLSKFVKEAQEWIAAATSGQSQVVALKEALDRERTRAERMEQQIELLMQRIEGNEGTRFTRPAPTWQNEVTEAVDAAESLDDVEVQLEKRGRGRPRKI
jgi:chromosome segregation ATPase